MTDPIPTPASATGSSTDALRSDAGAVRETLGQARDYVADEARSFAQSAKDKAEHAAGDKKAQIATAMEDFAAAMRKAGDELEERDQTFAAQLLGQAMDGLEQLTRSLNDKSPQEMIHSVRDFGRHNPTAFVAGSVLAGFALGRFARSSEHHLSGGAAEPSSATQPQVAERQPEHAGGDVDQALIQRPTPTVPGQNMADLAGDLTAVESVEGAGQDPAADPTNQTDPQQPIRGL